MCVPSANALAANGKPQRADGPVVSVVPSVNGGDNGWGNCGHNSSGGAAHSGTNGNGGGNGGHRKGEACVGDPGSGGDEGGGDVIEIY